MASGGVQELTAAIDVLARAEAVGVSQRDDLCALARQVARLEAQVARRLGELDASSEWSVDGSRSPAGWLIANLRCATGDAHHRVKVARQIAAMPIARAAWEAGDIGSRHVDALTQVRHTAEADAEFAVFEPVLVAVARTSRPEDVAATGKQWLDALDDQLGRDRSKKDRCGRAYFSRTLNGRGVLNATFDTEGAEIADAAIRRRYEQHHRLGDPRSPAEQRADVLVDIFRRDLDGQGRGSNRPHVIVAVDAETLSGEAVGRCETISGYRLNPDTVRRLSCDAIIQRIVLDSDGVPLDLGRATRTFTPDQYRAIMLRDGGCRTPGCAAGPEDCEAHHVTYWENGGLTNVAVGIGVCHGSGHHKLIHEGGWTITGDPNGEITFYDADGKFRGTSTPRGRPIPIPTRIGKQITRAKQRARALRLPDTVLPTAA